MIGEETAEEQQRQQQMRMYGREGLDAGSNPFMPRKCLSQTAGVSPGSPYDPYSKVSSPELYTMSP